MTEGTCAAPILKVDRHWQRICHFLAHGEQVFKLYRITFLVDMKNSPVWCGHSLTLVTSHFRNILRGQCFRRNLKHWSWNIALVSPFLIQKKCFRPFFDTFYKGAWRCKCETTTNSGASARTRYITTEIFSNFRSVFRTFFSLKSPKSFLKRQMEGS